VKKSRHHDTMVNVTHGYYLLHSTELCLIGVKSFSMNKKRGLNASSGAPQNESEHTQRLQYLSKVTNDVIFGKVSRQSQKPDEMYQVIEAMMPGARKVELFARNHNMRQGWLSLGNRLGPTFDSFDQEWQWNYNCDTCNADLSPIPHLKMNTQRAYVRKDTKAPVVGSKRYKSKKQQGHDLCETCVAGKDKQDYFLIENLCEEFIYHDWYNCDHCNQRPICGVRFSCVKCEDYDLCEGCFDQVILEQGGHKHDASTFDAIELPDPGMGFPVHHRIRCDSCYMCPIIGERFHCLECKELNFCRNCFFKKKEIKEHTSTHTMTLMPEAGTNNQNSHLRCVHCKKQKASAGCYKCKTCANFILCEECFEQHDELMPFERNPTHKQFHRFFKLR